MGELSFRKKEAVSIAPFLLNAPKSPKEDLLIFRLLFKPHLGGRGRNQAFDTAPFHFLNSCYKPAAVKASIEFCNKAVV